jgi:hypothetical protein
VSDNRFHRHEATSALVLHLYLLIIVPFGSQEDNQENLDFSLNLKLHVINCYYIIYNDNRAPVVGDCNESTKPPQIPVHVLIKKIPLNAKFRGTLVSPARKPVVGIK